MDALVFLILGGSICYSLHIVIIARLVRPSSPVPRSDSHPLLVMGMTHVIGGALTTAFLLSGFWPGGSQAARWDFYLLTCFAALLHLASKTCHFMALRLEDVALVGAFSALSPVLATLIAWAVLSEVPTWKGAAGIAIVVTALVALQLSGRTAPPGERIGPPRSSLLRNGLFLAFLSAVIPSLGLVIGKMAISNANPLLYAHHALWLAGAGAIAICWREQGGERLLRDVRSSSSTALVFSSALMAASTIQFSAALLYDVAAHVSAMTRLTIPMQVMLGYAFAGQRERFAARMLWSTIILFGIVVIALGRSG